MIGIYKITNKQNGKLYIGRSKDIFNRWKSHLTSLRKKKHGNQHLQEDFNAFGIDNFSFEIVEVCKIGESIARESHYIEKYNAVKNGYNIVPNENQLFEDNILDPIITAYAKNAFKKTKAANSCSLKILDEDTTQHLISMFGSIDMARPESEIFIVPNKYEEQKLPPFIFLYSDFLIE